ncbi:hypothetical protein DL93DRAFT_2082357 [Clavulina sp. PMI_390]|nr:hypothetical protein DL93DRAFT_2082357 [Clavulina sp. PMI_390]
MAEIWASDERLMASTMKIFEEAKMFAHSICGKHSPFSSIVEAGDQTTYLNREWAGRAQGALSSP